MDFPKNQQRQSGNIKPSNSAASLNKSLQQNQLPFDILSSLGGDLNSAVAAITAAASSGLDNATALAQLNAIAQLNQLAATNPKIAAAAMMQLQQQHFGSQSSLNSQSSSLPMSSSLSMSASSSQLPTLSSSGASSASLSSSAASGGNTKMNQTRYQQLLNIIEEMGREIRTSYSGNKNSIERLKRGIASARILVKDCQIECDRNIKQ